MPYDDTVYIKMMPCNLFARHYFFLLGLLINDLNANNYRNYVILRIFIFNRKDIEVRKYL